MDTSHLVNEDVAYLNDLQEKLYMHTQQKALKFKVSTWIPIGPSVLIFSVQRLFSDDDLAIDNVSLNWQLSICRPSAEPLHVLYILTDKIHNFTDSTIKKSLTTSYI
jgi:hypothetical protein